MRDSGMKDNGKARVPHMTIKESLFTKVPNILLSPLSSLSSLSLSPLSPLSPLSLSPLPLSLISRLSSLFTSHVSRPTSFVSLIDSRLLEEW